MPKTLIYLHGFNSSPDALKAQEIATYIDQQQLDINFIRPAMPDTPDKVEQFLDNLMSPLQEAEVSLVGSSLGGYYATWLAQRYDLHAVLVNPAVRPYELMHQYLGINRNPYSGAEYELTNHHMETLKSFYLVNGFQPQRYLLLVQLGDEVLNAQEAVERYRDSQSIIESGGDHRFENFEKHIPAIFRWLSLE